MFFAGLGFCLCASINHKAREILFKLKRIFLVALFLVPGASWAAGSSDFYMAAQLLSAAHNGDTRLVQNLINSGANVNYVDSTGVSVVCTAVMNNDRMAIQVLQMYGADASQCDRQIKNYRTRNTYNSDTGLFSGLTPTHKLVLGALGTAGVIAGLLWATDAFDSSSHDHHHNSGGSGGSGDDDPSGGGTSLTAAFTIPYGPAMVDSSGEVDSSYNYTDALNLYSSGALATNFTTMNNYGNYLLMMHGYSTFARGYLGQSTLRYSSANNFSPVPGAIYGQSQLNVAVSGGIPINVALVTANGINAQTDTSLEDRFFVWSKMNGTSVLPASNSMISSKYFNNNIILGSDSATIADDTVQEITGFDLSGNLTAIHNTSATNLDNLLAKIVGGYTSGAATGDFTGFMPNGQMTIYRTGGGKDSLNNDTNYYNYRALVNAMPYLVDNLTIASTTPVSSGIGRAKISVIANTDVIAPLYAVDTYTLEDLINDYSSEDYQTVFYNKISTYYGNNVTTPIGLNTPAQDAAIFYTDLGVSYYPLTVFSVGATQTNSLYEGAYQNATFENAVPLTFSNAKGLFMSVVAVNLQGVSGNAGTSGAGSVAGFSAPTTYVLSQWQTGSDYYKSRICGIAGTGSAGVDPWCFAGAGVTDEQATAAVAGAAGAVKSAFSYLSNKSIFNLLALTADGAYLGTNPGNGQVWTDTDELVSYLSSMYTLPQTYQTKITNGTMTYLDAFKEVFGYGLINLDRATMPGKSIYYYTDGKIVGTNGKNAYWRSGVNNLSGAFGARSASIPMSYYDILSSADGSVSVPRIWNTSLTLGNDLEHGLYMGDTLSELKTRDIDNTVQVGNLKFGFARSERAYDDNMSGVDNLSLSYDNGQFGLCSEYQHYLTDGNGRFTGMANPVLSLASDAVSTRVEMHSGKLSLLGRGFVGTITTEGLLDNDPVVSSNFESAKLGNVMGAESGVQFSGDKLSFVSNVGTMHESNTVLGASFGGMLSMQGADTNYIDSVLSYAVSDDVKFSMRGTFAWTRANDMMGGIINGVSELKSNAFAVESKIGNFDLSVSMPLAITDGRLHYSYAEFDVDDDDNLFMHDAGERSLDLTPKSREYRFNAAYRHKFGDWTDGALGFIYRINPNNTDKFGNESIFMMKMSHRLGI